jgi:hypothetical protein
MWRDTQKKSAASDGFIIKNKELLTDAKRRNKTVCLELHIRRNL